MRFSVRSIDGFTTGSLTAGSCVLGMREDLWGEHLELSNAQKIVQFTSVPAGRLRVRHYGNGAFFLAEVEQKGRNPRLRCTPAVVEDAGSDGFVSPKNKSAGKKLSASAVKLRLLRR